MTGQKFKGFTRELANNTIKLENGLVSQEQYILDMKVLLGEDVFSEVREIIKQNTKFRKGE